MSTPLIQCVCVYVCVHAKMGKKYKAGSAEHLMQENEAGKPNQFPAPGKQTSVWQALSSLSRVPD